MTFSNNSNISSKAAELAKMANSSLGDLENYYDKWSDSYDKDLMAMGYEAPRVAAEAVRNQGVDPAKPVLDAGCGTGLTGLELRKAGFEQIMGVDLSTASLELARQKGCYKELKRQNLNEPLGFSDDQFVAAQCVGTLSYVDNIPGLMREFCRVVCPSGIVLFTHRVDLLNGHFESLLDEIAEESLWTPLFRSQPKPYIPGHKDFGEEKTIIYDIYQVN
ncbi:MAG: class I SAM-dependent DNA methyltransferase [Phyllobacterium sp.]